MRFNQSQSRAIDHFQGPALILAGPGSGKTAVITYRVKNLITKYHIPPEKILVLTFSRAAADQMQERYSALPGGGQQTGGTHTNGRPVFGTFHSFFLRILRQLGGYAGEKILSGAEKKALLKELAASDPIDQEEESFWDTLAGEISRVKCAASSLPQVSVLPQGLFFRLFDAYERALQVRHQLDFDDILCRTFELLSLRKDILSSLQEQFTFFLIDEFQDVSQMQYAIMKLLAARDQNLFAVGDDDQAIYAFRGASAGILRQFLSDYPKAAKILLNVNYRSVPPIIRSALEVIAANKERFQKDIHCYWKGSDADAFCIWEEETMETEYTHMAEQIRTLLDQGCPPETIAILVRSTTDLPLLRSILERRCIRVRGSASSEAAFTDPAFDSFLCKDMTGYLKIAATLAEKLPPASVTRQDLLQILNKPSRFLSKQALGQPQSQMPSGKAFETIRGLLSSLKAYYKNVPERAAAIDQFERDLNILSSCTPYAAFVYIWNQIGYRNYVEEFCRKNHRSFAEMEQIFFTLTQAASEMTTFRQWEAFLKERQKQPQTEKENGIFVMTMHASKGLEFDIVFLPDLNEGLLPHKKADTQELIAEERRLLYVAMTRAAQKLTLSYVRDYHNKKATRSRFLDCFF